MSRRSLACAAALALSLSLPLAGGAQAPSPSAPPAAGETQWVEFGEKPVKLGKEAKSAELTFSLVRFGRSYVLHIEAEGVASAQGGPGSEDYQKGYGQVRLFLNGRYVGNLNDFAKPAKGPGVARVPLPEGAARGGLNRLEVRLEGPKRGRFEEVTLRRGALEVSPAAPEARAPADLSLLDIQLDPFHVGDQGRVLVRDFEVGLPAGARFFAVELEAKGVVPVRGGMDSRFYAQGHYQARVMVNGEFLGNLNEFFSTEEADQEWTRVRLFAPSHFFRAGKNTVTIRSDAPVGDNHDDFDVRLLRLEVVR